MSLDWRVQSDCGPVQFLQFYLFSSTTTHPLVIILHEEIPPFFFQVNLKINPYVAQGQWKQLNEIA